MEINHRTVSKFSRYLMLSVAGSGSVYVSELIPETRIVFALLALLGLAYGLVFAARYYGVFSGRRWAQSLNIHELDSGMLDYLTFASFATVGVVAAWQTL